MADRPPLPNAAWLRAARSVPPEAIRSILTAYRERQRQRALAQMAQQPDVLPRLALPTGEAERRALRAGTPARAATPLDVGTQQIHGAETQALLSSGLRMAAAGPVGRTLVTAARTAAAPVEAAIQLAAPGTETPYGRGAEGLRQLKEAGLDPTTPTEETIGTLAGSAAPFEAASVATGPVTQALVRRLGARGVPLALREAVGGAAHTAGTLSLGSGAQATTEALAEQRPVPEALATGLEAGVEAVNPRHALPAAFLGAGALTGALRGAGRAVGYAERLQAVREERAAREAGFGPVLPAEGPDRLRSLSDAEIDALSPTPPGPVHTAAAPPRVDVRDAPPSVLPPSGPAPPRREIHLPAGAPRVLGGPEARLAERAPQRGTPGVLGSGPLLGGGRANLAAGTVGAMAGYTQGETPEEKLLGALTGATVGSGIVESLRRRRGGRLASGPIVPHEPAPLAPDVSGFRSRMRDAVTGAPFARGTAEQWRAHLGKGVNQAELKDTGLGQFLDAHKGQVLDRDAVLAAGQPTPVTEVRYPVKRRSPDQDMLDAEREAATRAHAMRLALISGGHEHGVVNPAVIADAVGEMTQRGFGGEEIAQRLSHVPELRPLVLDYAGAVRRSLDATEANDALDASAVPARYAEYTLPGGQNYREVVLTTPGNERPLTVGERVGWSQSLGDLGVGVGSGTVTAVEPWSAGVRVRVRDEAGRIHTMDAGQVERENALEGSPHHFTSSHWPGVENPVAHLRLTDRQTPDGQKMTFLEEIQSDVHEQGREKGYRDPEVELQADAAEQGIYQAARMLKDHLKQENPSAAGQYETMGNNALVATARRGRFTREAKAAADALDRAISTSAAVPKTGTVPKLPFSRTEDWVGLTVRRALAEAVATGADRLGWTTGVQQAQRYSQQLQRGLSGVRWDPDSGRLQYRRAGSTTWETFGNHPAGELDGVVGRQVADNLRNQQLAGRPVPTVEGTDLVIGATGMRTFYDEIVPRVVTDYLKKLGVKDVKPEQTPLAVARQGATRTFTGEEITRARETAEAAGEVDVANLIDWLSSGRETMTVGHVNDLVRVGPARTRVLELLRDAQAGSREGATVWSIPITPELKAKVQSGEGTYLYSGLDPTLLKKLPPAAVGAAVGAGVGAAQGKDTKERIALGLAGAAVGAVGGHGISRALRERRAVASAERGAAAVMPVAEPAPEAPAVPERQLRLVPNEPTAGAPAAQPGGLPVEPPVKPSDYVNPAKFDLDPTGRTRLDAEVERLVTETGLHPKTVVTHAEVRRAASDLGVDIDAGDQQVNRRISGAKLLAIRNIVSANIARQEQLAHELAEPTTLSAERKLEVTRQMGALDAQNSNLLGEFVRARTAAGRELNALKIVANRSLDPAVWWTKAQQVAGRDLTADELVTIRRLVEERDRAGLVQMVSRLRTSSVGEQLTTLWKAGLLTNPKTHLVNITGNTAMAALETAKDPVAAGFDWLLSLRTQQRTKGGLNRFLVGASAKGVRLGLAEAGEVMKGRLVGSQLERGQLPRETTIDLPGLPKSANALLDGYQRWVYRALGASDQVFVRLALQRSLVEQAQLAGRRMGMRGVQLRDYVAGIQRGEGPLADVISAQAVKDANVATFHDVTRLGRAAASFAREVPGGQFIVPFQKTPGAVATRVLEYSPLGLAKGVVDAVKVGLKGKNAPPALQRIAAEELGRGATGSGVVYLGYMLAHYGLMTGAAPTFGSTKRQQWTQEGRRPNSLLVGTNWLEIGRLSPLGNLLALGANLREALEEPKTPDIAGRAAEVGFSALRTVADQPFVTGASQALAAIQEPEREAARFAQGLAGSVVPAFVGAVARGTDVARVPELEAAGPFSGVAGAIAERIPGVRKVLPAKRTAFGDQVPSRGILNAMFNPTTASLDLRQSDPVVGALADVGYAVPRLPRQKGEGAHAYTQRQRVYGTVTRAALEATLQSGDYAAATQVDQQLDAAVQQALHDPRFAGRSPEAVREALDAVAQHGGLKTRADVLAAAVASVRRQLRAAP